jgi:hypothetical protein
MRAARRDGVPNYPFTVTGVGVLEVVGTTAHLTDIVLQEG